MVGCGGNRVGLGSVCWKDIVVVGSVVVVALGGGVVVVTGDIVGRVAVDVVAVFGRAVVVNSGFWIARRDLRVEMEKQILNMPSCLSCISYFKEFFGNSKKNGFIFGSC